MLLHSQNENETDTSSQRDHQPERKTVREWQSQLLSDDWKTVPCTHTLITSFALDNSAQRIVYTHIDRHMRDSCQVPHFSLAISTSAAWREYRATCSSFSGARSLSVLLFADRLCRRCQNKLSRSPKREQKNGCLVMRTS